MFINYNFLRFASFFNSIIVKVIKGQRFDIELMTDFPDMFCKGDLIREKCSLVQILDGRPPRIY